jgi:hypothetical protein
LANPTETPYVTTASQTANALLPMTISGELQAVRMPGELLTREKVMGRL